MKIVYDATPLLFRSAGVKNYHHALLRRLIPHIEPDSLELFPFLHQLTPNDNERSNYPGLATAWRLATVLGSNYLHLPVTQWAARNCDLFHTTHHVWNLPQNVPLSSMVHDPTPLLLPECHTHSNVRYFERFVEKTLPRLRGVIAPSHAVKQELVRRFGYPESRVMVIYHGVEEDFFDASHAARLKAREIYNLPPNYVLFVGSMEPRKNLLRLLDAYARLPSSLRKAYPLVITGARGWKNAEIQKALSRVSPIYATGYVRPRLLPAVYHMASCFVFPSLYEGFGLPVLEAMAAGLPVIASNTSAIPEVVGESALLVDPRSPPQLARALQQVLEDSHAFADMGLAARKRAREFNWNRAAAATKKFFELCLRS